MIQDKKKLKKEDHHQSTTLKEKREEPTRFVVFNLIEDATQKIGTRFKKYGVSVAFKIQNTMNRILHLQIEYIDKFDQPGNNCGNF